jgi:hypothetical protein
MLGMTLLAMAMVSLRSLFHLVVAENISASARDVADEYTTRGQAKTAVKIQTGGLNVDADQRLSAYRVGQYGQLDTLSTDKIVARVCWFGN